MHETLSPTAQLTCDLIARESVTPHDAGCQALLRERLDAAGFACETLCFGEVTNLWATLGAGPPTLAFAGHTDVVPSGPPDDWHTPPFEPSLRDGVLYGRGAADMKGSVAAMLTAAERFAAASPGFTGTLALLITSDEEGPAVDGTVRVIDTLRERGQALDWCVVGEPSSSRRLGDVVRNGRRGSLSGQLQVIGTQGHVAYPSLSDNPIHRLARILARLADESWDAGNEYFPPTSFQVSNCGAGTGVDNVVPGTAEARFNFRFSTASTPEQLQHRVGQIVQALAPRHRLDWRLSGLPFLTPQGHLTDAVSAALEQCLQVTPELSTGGGTSDGRFIAQLGTQVVELGPINATIHQIDECVTLADLDRLSAVYQDIMRRLLSAA